MGRRTALLILLSAKDKRPPIVKVVSAGTSSSMRQRQIRHGKVKENQALLRRKTKKEAKQKTEKIREKRGRGRERE